MEKCFCGRQLVAIPGVVGADTCPAGHVTVTGQNVRLLSGHQSCPIHGNELGVAVIDGLTLRWVLSCGKEVNRWVYGSSEALHKSCGW